MTQQPLSRRQALGALGAAPAVFLPLTAGGHTTAAGAGADYVRATDYPTLQAAHDAAALTPARRLYIPAGTYADGVAESLAVAADMDIIGDGEEKTVLQMAAGLTGQQYGIRLYGPRARVAGLSIRGAQVAGGNQYGVSATFGADSWRLEDITVSGITGTAQAGGSGFDFYQPSATNGGWHTGTAARLTARDIPTGCGFVVNSQGNSFADCRALACGANSSQHGWYIQGGGNTFATCAAERSSGYNWHGYAAVPERAASYNVYRGCVSVDPTFGHFIATSIAAGASNPDVPSGTPLNRGVTIEGCTFRRTKTGPACGQGVNLSVPAALADCVFEDTLGGAGAWLSIGAGGRMIGTQLRMTATPPNSNIYGVVCAGGALVQSNQWINWLVGTAIRADGLAGIFGNSLDLYGGIGLHINGTDVRHSGNLMQLHGSAKATYGTFYAD